MSEGLDRDEILSLLNRLGDEDDAVVLSSGRELHARVVAAQISWDHLLVPDASSGDTAPEEVEEFPEEVEEFPEEVGELPEEVGELPEEVGELPEEEETAETVDSVDEEPDPEEKSARSGSGKRASPRRTTDAQALKLINQLLERRDISKSLREELAGYKEDIDEGELDDADRNYLRALHRRLLKR